MNNNGHRALKLHLCTRFLDGSGKFCNVALRIEHFLPR